MRKISDGYNYLIKIGEIERKRVFFKEFYVMPINFYQNNCELVDEGDKRADLKENKTLNILVTKEEMKDFYA